MTREKTMTQPFLKTFVVLGLAAGSLAVALPASAANWRHGGSRDVSSTHSYTGAHGRTWTRTGATSCADGSCTRSATVTGPDGRSTSRDETVTRTGRGDFSTSGSVTGPNGRTVSNQRQTDCGRYACARTGAITGPNGGSASTSGWWWR